MQISPDNFLEVKMQFLSDIFDAAKSLNGAGFFMEKSLKLVDVHQNIHEKYQIRQYQHESIGRLCYYLDEYPNARKPAHLLFNLATGSGKTLIMAAAILKLANDGYRKFVFTTRLSSVVHKTLDNLLNVSSSKYLFAENLTLNGQSVEIRKVSNFSGQPEPNVIEIIFLTTSALHSAIKNPKENGLSLTEVVDNPLVLLADEAHNLSTDTLSKTEAREEFENWESTVHALHNLNPSNVLLEFTATARIEDLDPRIVAKYKDVLLHRFTLKEMRQEGFSKNVITIQLDAPLYLRVLSALVLSLYRELVAAKLSVHLKTAVMFKANRLNLKDQVIDRDTINPTFVGSENFLSFYRDFMETLNEDDINELRVNSHGDLKTALEFLEQEIGTGSMISTLKASFSNTALLSVDSNKELRDKNRLLNSLEDISNPIRAVLATESLNEGWDVQNLFDIVRLYDSRDAKGNKAGKNTIQEAQLIGRGARYFPFSLDGAAATFQRKFDDSTVSAHQWLEKLAYHSMRNPRYIQELEQVLVDQGILASNTVQREITPKPEVLLDPWASTEIFSNSLVPKTEDSVKARTNGIPDRCKSTILDLPTFEQIAHAVFGDSGNFDFKSDTKTVNFRSSEFEWQVWLSALDRLQGGTYEQLSRFLPFLKSRKEFILGENYLPSVIIQVTGNSEQLNAMSQQLQYQIALQVCKNVLDKLMKIESVGFGDFVFTPRLFTDVFGKSKTLNFDEQNPRSKGDSAFAFATWDWFAQNEIWGTSEEYSLVRFVESQIDTIKQHWSEVLLVRNEGHMSIYDFDSGQRFNPDFLLLLGRNSRSGRELLQVFIEPKGDQFLDAAKTFSGGAESWKESLLETLEVRSQIKQDALSTVRVAGLPFYNAGLSNHGLHTRFVEAFRQLITN